MTKVITIVTDTRFRRDVPLSQFHDVIREDHEIDLTQLTPDTTFTITANNGHLETGFVDSLPKHTLKRGVLFLDATGIEFTKGNISNTFKEVRGFDKGLSDLVTYISANREDIVYIVFVISGEVQPTVLGLISASIYVEVFDRIVDVRHVKCYAGHNSYTPHIETRYQLRELGEFISRNRALIKGVTLFDSSRNPHEVIDEADFAAFIGMLLNTPILVGDPRIVVWFNVGCPVTMNIYDATPPNSGELRLTSGLEHTNQYFYQ